MIKTEGHAPMPRWRRLLDTWAPLLLLLLVWLGFALAYAMKADVRNPWDMFSPRTVATILVQTSGIAVAAAGMTFVVILGGIDLAAGSIIALTCVVTALGLESGQHPVLAATYGLLTGLLCGCLSGVIIATLRVKAFIATLGMLVIARGAAKLLADNQSIVYDQQAFPGFDALMVPLHTGGGFALAPGVFIAAGCVLALWILLRFTIFGRHVTAIGSNPQAARLCGIPVHFHTIVVFALCGLCAAVAGILETARLHVGDPTTAPGRELDIIAAVVIGGASLSGGKGSIPGAVVGALLMSVLRAGAQRMEWPQAWQEIIIGAIIIIAVASERWRSSSASDKQSFS